MRHARQSQQEPSAYRPLQKSILIDDIMANDLHLNLPKQSHNQDTEPKQATADPRTFQNSSNAQSNSSIQTGRILKAMLSTSESNVMTLHDPSIHKQVGGAIMDSLYDEERLEQEAANTAAIQNALQKSVLQQHLIDNSKRISHISQITGQMPPTAPTAPNMNSLTAYPMLNLTGDNNFEGMKSPAPLYSSNYMAHSALLDLSQYAPDENQLWNSTSQFHYGPVAMGDMGLPALRTQQNPFKNGRITGMRANTVERAFFKNERLHDDGSDFMNASYAYPNLNRGKFHNTKKKVSTKLTKLRQKIEKKSRNIYKMETYEKRNDGRDGGFMGYKTQQPRVTYKDFEREYDEKLDFLNKLTLPSNEMPQDEQIKIEDNEEDANDDGKANSQGGVNSNSVITHPASRHINFSIMRKSYNNSNLGHRILMGKLDQNALSSPLNSSPHNFYTNMAPSMNQTRSGGPHKFPQSTGSVTKLNFTRGLQKNPWQNLTNQFDMKKQREQPVQWVPISPRSLANMYRKKGGHKIAQTASTGRLDTNAITQQQPANEHQSQLTYIKDDAARKTLSGQRKFIPLKQKNQEPLPYINKEKKMTVNISPLKLVQRQMKGKLLEPIGDREDSQKRKGFEKKKDSLIYIINKNKDLSHDFVQQTILQQLKNNAQQQLAVNSSNNTLMDKTIIYDKTQLNSTLV